MGVPNIDSWNEHRLVITLLRVVAELCDDIDTVFVTLPGFTAEADEDGWDKDDAAEQKRIVESAPLELMCVWRRLDDDASLGGENSGNNPIISFRINLEDPFPKKYNDLFKFQHSKISHNFTNKTN